MAEDSETTQLTGVGDDGRRCARLPRAQTPVDDVKLKMNQACWGWLIEGPRKLENEHAPARGAQLSSFFFFMF
jgi:hypothetical protein